MNVAQELSDRELSDYDAIVGLLSARFDPASRVSASRSRFHGRTRRHQEDADTYADSITELCRLGYPQSSPELRQELISSLCTLLNNTIVLQKGHSYLPPINGAACNSHAQPLFTYMKMLKFTYMKSRSMRLS